jgi:two-component system CheB/CheR fusion protein
MGGEKEAYDSQQTTEGGPTSYIVALGASAGGLEALLSFFEATPSDTGLGYVVVVHLAPDHVSLLPELLQKKTKMPVRTAVDGELVEPDRVYVIPPNSEMGILNGSLQVMKGVQIKRPILPIDAFFRSLADDRGSHAICAVLSGTGTDGVLGVRAIKGHAGMAMVQDPESAGYDGMPKSAVATGLADYVLEPAEMPARAIDYVRHKASAKVTADGAVDEALSKIYLVLRTRTGHDFSLYKEKTIRRRLERRMTVHQMRDVSAYVRYLRESERETRILFEELLVGVTSFFRDPPVFELLAQKVLPELLPDKPADYVVRVWVPGCSSGEEAYTLAMLLQESMEAMGRSFPVQIFGTDIDERAIEVARAGIYPGSIAADVDQDRLARHFVKNDDGSYTVRKSIRSMLVFALQNVIKDPPFTKLDLLSCRNLLIYLGSDLQSKLLPLFHYSLRESGILLLGSSETIGQATDLFASLHRKWKIFRRKPSSWATHRTLEFPAGAPSPRPRTAEAEPMGQIPAERTTVQLLETILRESPSPPCAVIDGEGNVVYIHGRTGRFLEPPEGKPTASIVEMARPGLRSVLASAIADATLRRREVLRSKIRVSQNGGYEYVGLRVRPIPEQIGGSRLLMVIFEDVTAPRESEKPEVVSTDSQRATREELEVRLEETRETLRTTVEELETANEELTSTNEELQSTNEELQSTNEELETSKEELQSLNEEAVSANAELQSRIDELTLINDDMRNLLDSTDIAVIFLDTELCVRRFTPRATEIIPLTASDRGRPIQHFASELVGVKLEEYARETLEDLETREIEAATRRGRGLHLRVRPYRTTANVIDGVVITFQDITALRGALRQATEVSNRAEAILNAVREPLLILDAELRVMSANRVFYECFQTNEEQTVGAVIFEMAGGHWDIPALRTLLDELLSEREIVEGFVIEDDLAGIGSGALVLNARRIDSVGEHGATIVLAFVGATGDTAWRNASR